ncbi:MAG: Ig-like domain-containing protein [Muribaculaceae bacterium]|nr:Ig-like domain-containing protein [Muribaculaceae bacterium]
MLSSGAIRILIASQTLKEFSGNSGALVTFNIIADANFSGTKTIQLQNIIASEVDRTEHILPNSSCTVTSTGGGGGGEQPVLSTLTLSDQLVQLEVLETKDISVTTENAGAITWTSSDASVATVDSNGHVTALKRG